jgi:hypothetical protein
MHTVINAVNPFVWHWFDGTDRLHLWWIWAGLWALLTAAIIAVNGPGLTRNTAALARCGVPTSTVDSPAGGVDRSGVRGQAGATTTCLTCAM